MRHSFHPWRHLRALAHVVIEEHHEDDAELGWTLWASPPRISLRRGLLQAERRSTLTHELVHLERGPLPEHDVLDAREEVAVECEAARRLISTLHLVWAPQWSPDEHELAEELWVDVGHGASAAAVPDAH